MNSRELSEQARNVLRNIPLDNLDIPNRVKNALSRQKIDNALEAIITIESRLEGTKGIGEKSVNESIKSVQNVLSKINEIEPDLIHNFLDYRETYFEHANGNFLEILIPIVDLYFEKKTSKHGLRDRDVLYKRFNLENQGSYTLEDIGTYYDLTRERVRQIEAKSIADLQKILLGTYGNSKWKLDTRITDRYRELSAALKSKDFILTDNELKSLLDELFESTPHDTVLSLLMEIVGYTELPNRIDGFRGSLKKCWCSTSQFNRKELEAIFRSLDIIFDRVEPIKMFDLIVSAKKKAKKKVSNDSIHVALKACEQIEVEDDLVSIKFNYLRSAADKAYRILVSKNKPMHFSDLCKEINLVDGQHTRDSKPINQTNMKNQLVGDARFKPIGRSGEWGLASWAEFENITIVQAIESVLHRSGSPLTFAEFSRGVNEIRPDASKRSFRVYLTNEPEKFTQVDQDLYALASWQMSPFQRRSVQKVTTREFYEVARAILQQQNPMAMPEFIRKMCNKTGLKEPSVRSRLKDSRILENRKTSHRHNEIYCKDINFDIEEAGVVRVLILYWFSVNWTRF